MSIARRDEMVLVRDKKRNVYKAFAGTISDDVMIEPAERKVSLVEDRVSGAAFKVFNDDLRKFSPDRFKVSDSWGDSWGDSWCCVTNSYPMIPIAGSRMRPGLSG